MSKLPYGIYDIDYEDIEEPIPAVVLGDGSICVCSLVRADDGFYGVGFSELDKPVDKIGDIVFEDGDISFKDLNCKFHILADNPDSLQVIIDHFVEAKKELELNNENNKSS